MVEENILLGDLFDDDLYLLCVISILRLLKLGVTAKIMAARTLVILSSV